MTSFHDAGPRPRTLIPTTDAEGRLPRGGAMLVIPGLSALSWVVLVAIVIALRASD